MSKLPGFRGVDHVALTVPDLEEAIEFFVEALGAEFVFTDTPNPPEGGAWFERQLDVPTDSQIRIAMLRLDQAMNIELFEYTTRDQRTTPPRNSDIGGGHLALYVDDVEKAATYLDAYEGVEILGTINHISEGPFGGLTMIYLRTPWGSFIELVSSPNGLAYEEETSARLARRVSANNP